MNLLPRKAFWIGFSTLGVILLAGALAFLFLLHSARRGFEERLARIAKAGAPVSLEDLEETPIPDEVNAASILQEAFAWLERSLPPEGAWPESLSKVFSIWTEDDLRQAKNFLEQFEPFFKLIEEAYERPMSQFPSKPESAFPEKWG